MNPNNKNETIVSRRCNLQTYLIYPEIEYMYGHFRNIWEGGKDGEAFIQSIKSHLHNGLAGNFSKNAMLSYFMGEFFDSFGVVCNDPVKPKMFITYKSSIHVTGILQENKLLSLVIISNEHDSFTLLSCILNKGNSDGEIITKYLEFIIDLEQENITKLGQQFFDLNLKLDDEINFSDDSIMCYGIALSFNNMYTIITSEWQQVMKVESMNDNHQILSSKLE